MYADGLVVKQSYSEAMKWYKRAAAQGNVVSMHNIGAMYYNGEGVERNSAEAKNG